MNISKNSHRKNVSKCSTSCLYIAQRDEMHCLRQKHPHENSKWQILQGQFHYSLMVVFGLSALRKRSWPQSVHSVTKHSRLSRETGSATLVQISWINHYKNDSRGQHVLKQYGGSLVQTLDQTLADFYSLGQHISYLQPRGIPNAPAGSEAQPCWFCSQDYSCFSYWRDIMTTDARSDMAFSSWTT